MSVPFDADSVLAHEVLDAAQPRPQQTVDTPPPPAAEPIAPTPERIPEFDPRWRDPFEGMLFLGRLEKQVTFWGHTFQLVTPSSNERLEISLLTKDYTETIGWEFAYSCALVAAYLVRVDGQDLPQPITNDDKDTALANRWRWVLSSLRKPVIDRLFEACAVLDADVRAILEAMGKASG